MSGYTDAELANPGLAVHQLLKMKAKGLITMAQFLEGRRSWVAGWRRGAVTGVARGGGLPGSLWACNY